MKRFESKYLTLRCLAISLCLLLAGCGGQMVAENAKTIRVEVTEGTGKAAGTLKASSPQTAGLGTNRFEFDIPGSFEVKGGPSEYMVVFDSASKEMKNSIKLSVDGKELKRGGDYVYEADKGPRLTFVVNDEAPKEASK